MLPGGGFPLPPAAQELCQILPPPNCFHGPHVVVEKLCEVSDWHLEVFFPHQLYVFRCSFPYACLTHSLPPPSVRATPPSCSSWPSRCSGREVARGEGGRRTARTRGERLPPTISTGRGCTRRLSEDIKIMSQANLTEIHHSSCT